MPYTSRFLNRFKRVLGGWALVIAAGAFQPAAGQWAMVTDTHTTFHGNVIRVESRSEFASNREAERAVERIMGYTGLPQNFEIQAADVQNAAAVIQNERRYILYNPSFMQQVDRVGDWAAFGKAYGELQKLLTRSGDSTP